jgi:large subunit ribosomal protein L3
MAKGHKPKAGSRAYWPKKRANRIYQTFKSFADGGTEVLPLVFAGYKAGMTRVVVPDTREGASGDIVRSVTVIDCPSLVVCGIRVYMNMPEGKKTLKTVFADNMNKDLGRKITMPKKKGAEKDKNFKLIDEQAEKVNDVRLLVHTKPRASGFGKKRPELFEIELGGDDAAAKWEYAKQKLGGEIKVEEVFKNGEWTDVKSVTKGKGFQGPVKRFGVTIRGRKHAGKRRHVGNIGSTGTGRVLPGKIAMPGQLGYQTRTEYNKRIFKIGNIPEGDVNPKGGFVNYGLVKGDYVLLQGSVPGPKKRLILFRKGLRASAKATESAEIKEVFLDSQQ